MIREYKEYLIQPAKLFPNNLVIATKGQGGSIPDMLLGMYTSGAIAKKAIDMYLESVIRKEEELVKAQAEMEKLKALETKLAAEKAKEDGEKKTDKRSVENAKEAEPKQSASGS